MQKRKILLRYRPVILSLLAITIILLISSFSALPVSKGATQVQVESAAVNPQQSFMNLPPGAQIYLYGYNVGASLQSGLFVNGQYFFIDNENGNIVDSLAVTANNSNGFGTPCGALTIAGIGISGFSSYTFTYGMNATSGAGSASDTFNVTSTGQLAVIIAFGGSQSMVRVSGISGMHVDASNVNSSGWVTSGLMPMIVGHSYLNKGQYTVSEISEGNVTQNTTANKTHMADLIGVFLFTPGTPSKTFTPTPTAGISIFQIIDVMVVVAVIAVVSLVVGIVIGTFIGRKTKGNLT
ncbi:MAG: hypothetical protein M1526_01675 [Candidatus Thermoplasmatota archaeon]|jgi:hypothetical protein|nr:hypothetical protein [Candidatus Thermoplasmatota archaeon]